MIQAFKEIKVQRMNYLGDFPFWKQIKKMYKPMTKLSINFPINGLWAVKVLVVTNVTGTLWEHEVDLSILNVTKGRKKVQNRV